MPSAAGALEVGARVDEGEADLGAELHHVGVAGEPGAAAERPVGGVPFDGDAGPRGGDPVGDGVGSALRVSMHDSDVLGTMKRDNRR
jgi:hypothetical protein